MFFDSKIEFYGPFARFAYVGFMPSNLEQTLLNNALYAKNSHLRLEKRVFRGYSNRSFTQNLRFWSENFKPLTSKIHFASTLQYSRALRVPVIGYGSVTKFVALEAKILRSLRFNT